MKQGMLWVATLGAGFALGWVVSPDNNDAPRFGKLGLPANCRAYVDVSIASYRLKRYTAEEVFAGLERNCGAGGSLWRESGR